VTTWVLETGVFADGHAGLEAAARRAGHRVVHWNDDWWEGGWPRLEGRVIFHGSLGNAARTKDLPWTPGAYCDVGAFCCSAWYPMAAAWLLHRTYVFLTARELAGRPEALGAGPYFVRPDSPLKPFSGRVLAREKLSLAALDHGFYYDDPELPVVVTPVRQVEREWRYVVVDRHVVAGSAYDPTGRQALPDDPTGGPWAYAATLAAQLPPPEAVYVLDVCAADGDLHLLELNPFSGADLYACSRDAIVGALG
jgi:hypothetical protein